MGTDSIPVAAGEPARMMIKTWAEAHGMVLYQGREGEKFPMRRWPKNAGYPCWEYVPWSGTGPAITQIHPFLGILDADDQEARERVAAMDLPPHFSTRGVSYSKGVITEHHYLALVGRPKRILGMTDGLDFLSNPDSQELWIKIWDDGYEVLSVQPGHPVPQIPDHLIELHHRAAEEQRQRKAADGDGVPVEKYRAEGIPSGHQSEELWASACNLAARRFQPAGILSVLDEIVEHSVLTKGPWQERTLASMADRAYRRYGKPPIVVEQMEMEDPDPALYPTDKDREQGPEPDQEPDSGSGPEPEKEDLSRHVTTPRLRVAPPAELAEFADGVIKDVLVPIWKVTYPARPANPGTEGAQWGDMSAAMRAVEPAAEVLGWLGDLDLLDYQRAVAIIGSAVLPAEYTSTLETGREALDIAFDAHFRAGWNKGATEGCEVPAHLQAALDAWHPPCPLPREGIEAHRLPGREGRWPVQNYVAKIDDRGNARRLLDHYGDRILFVDGQKGLGEYAFDEQRWLDVLSGGPGLVGEFADQMIQVLPVTEAMSLSVAVESLDENDRPVSNRGDYWKWLNMQQSNARRAGMIASAVTIPGMRVPVSVFDADPRWLNTPGGELDLGLLEIDADGRWHMAEPITHHPGQHYPEHYCSRITGVAYDPSALCPTWEQSMKAWLDDDELIVYLGKLLAASLRGLTIVKVIALLLGPGNSGKSTFLEVILAVLGSYATAAAPTILRKGKSSGTLSDDIAELRGYRFVSSTETSGAEEMDEPRLKRLSGGDRQRARGLYQASSEFDVQFLLWYATNFVPRLSGEDTALWGRFGPVMFPHIFTESGIGPDGKPCGVADPTLKKRLIAEGPGILAWIVRHLEKLYAEGLCEPASVTAKRQELQGQQDTSGQFIALAKAVSNPASSITEVSPRDPLLTTGSRLRIRWTSLYRHYEAWATFSKINAVGKDAFRASLENHGHKFVNHSGVPSVTGFGHRFSKMLAQCPVCEERLAEPKKPKRIIQR